ncbi:RING-H2 finger protein ATL60-like [Olea europaea var. sylvestris]|uniref:RING-H2 finger protein ATL60-like n=1 Tax=Olea europaea var. sylvestris TaxID=158386 RepID=UPI000C1D6CFE|nr:RING-H2 finger protein ATL60-like [Olea europaea var. sylvestris]
MSESPNIGDANVIEVSGKMILMTITVIIFLVVCVFCGHLYAKWVWNRRRENSTTGPGNQVTALRSGLDPTILRTIPVVIYYPNEFKDGLECAVCLSEVSQGEKTRFLPKCNHGFHMDCIDMWFQSHSTCPLCRDFISNPSNPEDTVIQTPIEENSGQPPNIPTNVLFWGNETQVSTFGPCLEDGTASSQPPCSSTNGMLVIDIPRQINEEEDEKSPVPSRLKRLLSGSMKFNPWSPRNEDMVRESSSQS